VAAQLHSLKLKKGPTWLIRWCLSQEEDYTVIIIEPNQPTLWESS